MIVEFFILWGFWFWGLVVIASLLLLICVNEEDSWVPGLVVLTLTFLAFTILGNGYQLITSVNPWKVAAYALGYFCIGITWTFPKWALLIHQLRKELDKITKEFKQRHSIDPLEKIPQNLLKEYGQHVWTLRKYGIDIATETGEVFPPNFTANRNRILTWAILWPWSMFWSLLKDFIKKAFEATINLFGKVYQRIATAIFGEF